VRALELPALDVLLAEQVLPTEVLARLLALGELGRSFLRVDSFLEGR
jgi:hypothetical protein